VAPIFLKVQAFKPDLLAVGGATAINGDAASFLTVCLGCADALEHLLTTELYTSRVNGFLSPVGRRAARAARSKAHHGDREKGKEKEASFHVVHRLKC
jgi:hypothetical protein